MKEYLLYLTDAQGMPYSTDALKRRLEQQLPSQSLKLYLSWADPDELVIRNLMALLSNLPLYVHAINCRELFENNKIKHPEILIKILASMPEGIRQLEADYLIPAQISLEHLDQILSMFPRAVEHLGLWGSAPAHIHYFIEHFASTYLNLNSLDIRALSTNESLSINSFNCMLSKLPQQITKLYINLNCFIKEHLHSSFSVFTFPQHLHTLGLMPKDFWQNETYLDVLNQSGVENLLWLEDPIWPELIAKTPLCIRSLSFDNYLNNNMEPKDFIACMAYIPPYVTNLSLKNNDLYLWPGDLLVQLLLAIPKTVKSLALEGNKLLSLRTNKGYEQLLKAIKPFHGVTFEMDPSPDQSEDFEISDPMTQSTEENDEPVHNQLSIRYKTQEFITDNDSSSYQSSSEHPFAFFRLNKSLAAADNLANSSGENSLDLLENSSINSTC